MIPIPEEEQQEIVNNLVNKYVRLANDSSNIDDFCKKVERDIAKSKMNVVKDGVTHNPVIKVTDEEVSNSKFNDGTAEGAERARNFESARKQYQYEEAENRFGVFNNAHEAKPSTQEYRRRKIYTQDSPENVKDPYAPENATNSRAYRDKKRNEDKEENERFTVAFESEKTGEWGNQVIFQKDSYKDCDGNSKTFTRKYFQVDWGKHFSDRKENSMLTKEQLLSLLTNTITTAVINDFGASRIHSIYVRDNTLIINDVGYSPMMDSNYVNENSNLFPDDTIAYLKNGFIAPFFDWYVIKTFKSLRVLDFDSRDFFYNYVTPCFLNTRNVGVELLFNECRSLDIIGIGGKYVNREDFSKDANEAAKKRANAMKEANSLWKRFTSWEDGYKINIYDGTNGMQKYTFDNLNTYAHNRGNRGILRFFGGMVVRTALFAGAGALNLATHLVGGVKNLFKTATTPVTEADME